MTSPDSYGTVDVAKEQATGVSQSAGSAASDVASTAKDEARNVASEAGAQVQDLGRQLRSQVDEQAGAQQDRLVQTLQSLQSELHSMAESGEDSGMATNAARQLADGAGRFARYLQQHQPGDLLRDLTDFGRRRPGAFLGGAVFAGLLAGRLTRGAAAAQHADSTPESTTPAPVTGYDVPDPAYAAPRSEDYLATPGYTGTAGYAGAPGYTTPVPAEPTMPPVVADGPPPAAVPAPPLPQPSYPGTTGLDGGRPGWNERE